MTARVLRALAVACALVLLPVVAAAQSARTDFWITNGQVNAQVVKDGKLYLGGTFSQVGAVTGAGLPVDQNTGLPDPGFPLVNGTVMCAIPDGVGGWYIGGQFTAVDGAARSNLAHVLVDHSVDSWNPGTNGAVRTIVLSGGQLYVGGDFTTLGTSSRSRAGSVDVVTGAVSAWNPNANGTVREFELNGSWMIVAGQFTTIGGQTRNRIAEVNLTNGAANTLWNPNANSSVLSIEISGGTLYLAGQFTNVGGQARNRIAALQLSSGNVLSWNPNASNTVNALAVHDGVVYAGGAFNSIGGQLRNRIAAVDSVTATATAWNPNASATVQVLRWSGWSLYVGGDFFTIGGQPRSRVAELSPATGLATAWNPSAFGSVQALGVASPEIFVGGAFSALGGVTRNNLAAFDIASGTATAWDPNANGQVQALLVHEGRIYAGGNFSTIGAQVRNGIAAMDTATGLPTAWDPNVSGQVSALAAGPGVIYAGGIFTNAGGQVRTNAAALDTATGLATAWAPEPDDQVLVLEPSGSTVYLGGSFLTAGGQPRTFLAAVDAATGVATAWNPGADGTVRAIAATCDRVYVGGFFTNVGGAARNRLAALDPGTGNALGWNPNSDGPVFAVTPGPGAVYVGGVFTSVGGQPRSRAAALDPPTGNVTSWNPSPNSTIRTIATAPDDVFLAGAFTAVGPSASGNVAAVPPDATHPCATITITPALLPPGVVGTPYAVASSATGGVAPWCWTLVSGTLPPGLSLDRSTGQLSGTPTASAVADLTVSATDAYGCSASLTRTLVVTNAPAVTAVAPQANGLCLNPALACVTVPFVLTRGETTALRDVRVTFHVEAAKLALCAAGPLTNSIRNGDWAAAFPNMGYSVLSNGGGAYTVRHLITSGACGPTTGGTLFEVDLRSLGYDGTASVVVDQVLALGCDGEPLAISLGGPATISGSTTAITVLPASLPNAVAGLSYSQTLTSAPGHTFTVTAGALPPGLTLSSGGVLSGTATQAGAFAFTVTATDAGGCTGSRAYSLGVDCQNVAVVPPVLPDGAVGAPYSYTLSASAGLAPFTFAVPTGTLPDGLTLSGAGVLAGTPTTAGQSLFRVSVTDAAGCSAGVDYVFDVFASAPVSQVAAVPGPLAISTANPCVSVPVVYTRGETTPVRGTKVTLQLDPAMLSLCTPAHPESSIVLGPWADDFGGSAFLVTDLGAGAYQVDFSILGLPCGITTGGTLFEVHVQAAGPDGDGTIGVSAVKVRDCDNGPVPVLAGAQGVVHVHLAPLTLGPTTLPNGVAGVAYSQTLTASGGTAPYTFTLLAGALPDGLELGAGGELGGTPTQTGTFGFTVGVTDAAGVPGTRVYTLAVTCGPITVAPTSLPFAQVGVPYAQMLTATSALTPVTWSVTSGALPAGLTLHPLTGMLAGTPTAAGFASFTATATDPAGCTGSESYGLSVFVDPAASNVAARTTGLCLSSVHPTVTVPFAYTRGEFANARSVQVTFALEAPVLELATPGSPAASIHAGAWLLTYGNRTFSVTDNGGGSYTVQYGLTGAPCGPDSSGTVFTVDVRASGADAIGHIAVTSVQAYGCDGLPLPAVPGATAPLAVSHTAPPAIGDLSAAQQLTGNGGSGRTGIVVTWTPPAPGTVALYRAPFGTYPEYDDAGGVTPDSSLAPAAPWTLVSANAVSGLVDHPPVRGFWHYVAFYTDSCGNTSAVSNLSRGALDYHLGDVSNRVAQGTGDNTVALEDVSLLGAHYGITGTQLATDGVAYLDVGPTTDGQPTSRPLTDNVLDFEDLLMFALDFRAVSAPQYAVEPLAHAAAGETFAIEAPSLVESGRTFDATLSVEASGAMQGFSVALEWNREVVEPVSVTSANWLEGQGGMVLSARPGAVDGVLLGRRSNGVEGAGDVARVRFRALREGDPGIRVGAVFARDAANRPLDPSRLGRVVRELVPTRTLLLAPAPNPAPGAAMLSFALARAGEVDLALDGVDGRRVATLAHGVYAAGMHHLDWQGEARDRGRVAPGVYWLRLDAAGVRDTRRLVLLR
ncbi:MAG: putative Ig domain-containing protein [Candidatus Eisenbacteria bacterium]